LGPLVLDDEVPAVSLKKNSKLEIVKTINTCRKINAILPKLVKIYEYKSASNDKIL